MILIQSVKMALKSILSNKLRSFLTMLGIIIGVFALVVLVSLVSGATSSITDTINDIGADQITVYYYDEHPLKMEDLENIAAFDSVTGTAPFLEASLTARTDKSTKRISIVGTTPDYVGIQSVKLVHGRFLMQPDIENNSRVCVINYNGAIEFFGRHNAVGETLKIDGINYTVIGVLDKTTLAEAMFSTSMTYSNFMVYVPFTTAARMNSSSTSVSSGISQFFIGAYPEDMGRAESDVRDYLVRLTRDPEANNFFIFNQSSISEAMDQITGVLSLLLGGIAGISLLVGGIGIMNIMLVSVTERTKEIGIRKAIGAGGGAIMLQFLIEAITLSIFGCGFGIGLSWLGMQVVNIIGNVHFGITPSVVMISVAFSSGVGVLFGLYPARKAAKMKPIDALRFN